MKNYFKPMQWDAYDCAEFTYRGRRWKARLRYDDAMGPPWKEHDGHGPVSEYESRSKKPGELIVCTSVSGRNRFYDFQTAVNMARTEWGCADPAKAAREDFERMRAWCNDEWHWVGVIVCRTDKHGNELEPSDSLWGIESDADEYLSETAYELVRNILS